VSDTNNTPASAHDEPIECTKVRKCGWKGMFSDLVPGAPVKGIKGATKQVCPRCGNDTYFRRALAASDSEGGGK
jgi:predicted RNA-binding Zn-ribbon protein involved in translation (DUF1610 family)